MVDEPPDDTGEVQTEPNILNQAELEEFLNHDKSFADHMARLKKPLVDPANLREAFNSYEIQRIKFHEKMTEYFKMAIDERNALGQEYAEHWARADHRGNFRRIFDRLMGAHGLYILAYSESVKCNLSAGLLVQQLVAFEKGKKDFKNSAMIRERLHALSKSIRELYAVLEINEGV